MRIEWIADARRDRRQHIDYVEAESLLNAAALDDRISVATSRLSLFPYSGRPGRVSGTRELVIPRTPYIAVYWVTENTVFIARLIHGAHQWPEDDD